MSSFLGKIQNIFKLDKKRRKYYLPLFFVFLAGFFIYKITPVHAGFLELVGDNVAAAIGSLITIICWGTVKLFIQLTIWASQLFITVASYNDFINSQAVVLGWVLVRDVVNMFFVVILLVIAFATVLGVEQYEWKKLMVKLLFAAVLINFSRLICGVIIDVAQVFTMTFVNGFAATAGGNVINALQLSKGFSLSGQAQAQDLSNDLNYLLAAMAAAFFAVLSFFVLGAYAFIMVARVVVLWVLIILSPIAFISSVLPATQKYSSEWWKQFNNHVLAGPILAFFFWLSFAVVGNGDIINEIDKNGTLQSSEKRAQSQGVATQLLSLDNASAGVSELLQWSTMASFVIAIALLMVGVEKTQELGVRGAGMLASAMSTAKKVGMYATGIRAAGWVSRKAPVIGTESLTRKAKGAKAWAETHRQDIMMKWDKVAGEGLKASEKAGGLKGFAGRTFFGAILTPMQKEKQLKNMEAAAEFAKKEREEKLGMGGTRLGFKAGGRMMAAEIAKEKAEEDKMTGLGRAKIEQYKKQKNYSAAIRAERNLAGRIMKMKSERFADMSQDDFVLETSKLTKDRKGLLEKLRTETDEGKKKGILKDISEKNLEIKTASIIASGRGGMVFDAVQGVIDKDSGIKNKDEAHAASYMASKMTGANTDTPEGRAEADMIMNYERENNKENFDYLNAQAAKAYAELQTRTSMHGAYVKGYSTGKVYEKGSGEDKYEVVKTDVGKNVGHATADGKERATGEKYDSFEVDASRDEYVNKLMQTSIREPINLTNLASNANLAPGEKIEIDLQKALPIQRALKELTPSGIIKALQSVKGQIDILTRQGHWDAARSNSLLKQFSENLNNKQQEAVKQALAGKGGDMSYTEDDYEGEKENTDGGGI